MKKKWKVPLDEKGSATIEFLGMVPLVFILLLIMWQMIVSIHGFVIVQSAANEAAKVYAVTKNPYEAEVAAQDILTAGSGYLVFKGAPVEDSNPDPKFTTRVNADIQLVFLPKKLFSGLTPSISVSSKASGRVIQ
jgi:hypothetical protein